MPNDRLAKGSRANGDGTTDIAVLISTRR